jgi:hypothetical protein
VIQRAAEGPDIGVEWCQPYAVVRCPKSCTNSPGMGWTCNVVKYVKAFDGDGGAKAAPGTYAHESRLQHVRGCERVAQRKCQNVCAPFPFAWRCAGPRVFGLSPPSAAFQGGGEAPQEHPCPWLRGCVAACVRRQNIAYWRKPRLLRIRIC